jgi:hypothetical protein
MAYRSQNLSILAYASACGFTLWHYVTEDDWFSVHSNDYFRDAAYVLKPNDKIEVNASNGNFSLSVDVSEPALLVVVVNRWGLQ